MIFNLLATRSNTFQLIKLFSTTMHGFVSCNPINFGKANVCESRNKNIVCF